MMWYEGKITFKIIFNDLEGHSLFSQNNFDSMKVKCTKFEVSTFISFEVIDN